MSPTSQSPDTPPLDQNDILQVQIVVSRAAINSFVEGFILLLAVMAIYTLTRRGLRGATARQWLLAAILISTLASCLALSTDIAIFILEITSLGDNPVSSSLLARLDVTGSVCARINYMVSDIIVVWRAWILTDRLIFRVGLAVCLTATIACTITECVITSLSDFVDVAVAKNPHLDLLLFVPLITTNALSTLVVSYRAWTYRREIKVHLHQQRGRSAVEKILVLVIESGAVYCVVWVINLLSAFLLFPTVVNQLLASTLPYISALYPILVILLVSLSRTDNDNSTDVPSRSLHFASTPRLQPHVSPSIMETMTDGRLHEATTDEEWRAWMFAEKNANDHIENAGVSQSTSS